MKYPRYDLMDGKIKGCKEGGFAYRHEYRHKLQHEGDWLSKFLMLFRYPSILVGSYYWGKNGFDVYTFFLLMPMMFFVYLELDAHLYAWRKRKCKR